MGPLRALQATSFFEFCLGEQGFKVSAYASCKGSVALQFSHCGQI